jgi:hypothetical protein
VGMPNSTRRALGQMSRRLSLSPKLEIANLKNLSHLTNSQCLSSVRCPMPRYFFHVHCDDEVHRDDEGLELSSLRTAVAEATKARTEIMTEDELDELWLEIMDQSGRIVAKVG